MVVLVGDAALKIHSFIPALIPGALSLVCLVSPAHAGGVASWTFDQNQNRLEFTTEDAVQPRAQLVPDPTRLVIDLPGITLGQPQINQLIGGAVRQVRIAQLNPQTTRVVIEMAPGYTLDPQNIRFRGLSPTHWIVQLPEPQYAASSADVPSSSANPEPANPASSTAPPAPSPVTSAPSPSPTPTPRPQRPNRSSSPSLNTPSAGTPSTTSSTAPIAQSPPSENHTRASGPSSAGGTQPTVPQIEDVRITSDGLFVRTVGGTPELARVRRSRDRRSLTITLNNAMLSPQLTQKQAINQYGASQLEFEQDRRSPPRVKLTLQLDRNSADWRAVTSPMGGIVLLPPNRNVASAPTPTPSPAPASATPSQPATIQGVELDTSGTQLLIRTDRPVAYTSRWQSGLYQITLSPSRLADRVAGPQLNASSPLLRVRLRQDGGNTVVISIQPASGVRFNELNAVTSQLLALNFTRTQPSPTVPLNAGALSSSSGSNSGRMAPLPRIPNGRAVVIVDPGHGGSDPGAIGINDLQEKGIVLAISQQVATLLEQQGVQAILTRTDDRDVELEPRVQMAEQANATLFVSIHANSLSMDRPDVNGVETYYYSSGEQLAEVVQSSIIQNLNVNDRGVRQARFYVLRRTTMPAILVEVGYVTGSEDAANLSDANFRNRMAQAIVRGVLQYLGQYSSTGGR